MPKPKSAPKAAQPPRKPSAPIDYTPALGEAICGLIGDGHTLRQVAARPTMPAKSAILRWAATDIGPGFKDQYARALALRAEAWAEEIVDISDESINDWRDREVKDGWVVHELNPEAIARSRLRVDARKWLLSKLLPKKYGDKVDVAHSTPDGPLVFRWQMPGEAKEPE